ncbi:MAG: alpha/beta hydrolase [candidate division KSB1 bacterium]|nr:alpha/beta hydrolase [candidate division KSB1 bacterium]MDQ7064341.1 alpha/beta hydrolase [candidate division KSB1 bacterium]
MYKNTGFVEANGVRLYYEQIGQGPHLVLIEGLGVATWLWEKQVPELSRHFRLLIYDNRGVGRSDKPGGPYSIAMLADDLKALLDSLDIRKTYVLGVSMGGFIALDFAYRYPEYVDRLVLVSTSAGGPDHVPMSQDVLQEMLATDGTPEELVRRKLALAFSEDFMRRPEFDHQVQVRLQNPQPPEAFMAQVAAGASFNLSEEVKAIRIPALVMAATGDRVVPVQNAHNLAAKLPNSQLKIYDGYGHQFFVEIPQVFNRDVIEFLQHK